MKRLMVIVLMGLIFTQVFVLHAQLKINRGDELYIKPEAENFRLSPNGSVVCQLPQGTKVIAIQDQGNWVAVQMVGYIWKKSLTDSRFNIDGFNLRALHILVATEDEANEVKKLLDEGADFKELARSRSKGPNAEKGGDLGLVSKGDLMPELDRELSSLKVGEISDIIKTEMGYHIFKRIE